MRALGTGEILRIALRQVGRVLVPPHAAGDDAGGAGAQCGVAVIAQIRSVVGHAGSLRCVGGGASYAGRRSAARVFVMRVIAVVFLLAAGLCGAQAQTLRVGIGSDPDVLDPTLSRSVAGRQVFASL